MDGFHFKSQQSCDNLTQTDNKFLWPTRKLILNCMNSGGGEGGGGQEILSYRVLV